MTWEATPTGKRGRPPDYSGEEDQETVPWTVFSPERAVPRFGMALRQTTGFVASLRRLIGLDWAVPNVSTLSRRPIEAGPWRR